MSANSIRSNLTKESIISEIKLLKSADIHKQKSYIIVEGIDDIKFCNGNVSSQVVLFESFSGKEGVIEIVSFFNSKDVLGICDRDYDTSYPHENIFFYDTSSLETMLISNKDTFSKVISILQPGIQDTNFLYNKIFEQLRWLSEFRKINAHDNLGINFQSISISKAYNTTNKELDISILFKQINTANKDFLEKHRDILVKVSTSIKQKRDIEDIILLTRGHDALNFFHCLCKRKKGKEVDNTTILLMFISAFNFNVSNLHTQLSEYGKKHALNIT